MSHVFKLTHMISVVVLIAVGLLCFSISEAAQPASSWKPTDNVEVVVGVSPGGSMDRTARMVRDSLVKYNLIPKASVVINKDGGGHAIAFAYTSRKTGNPHYIQIVNTPVMTNKLLGRNPLSWRDFTPLGIVYDEKTVFAVPVNSPIKDGRDLLARLRKDPASLSFSISSGVGTVQSFSVLQLGKAAGVSFKHLKTISFKGAAEGVTALLGGHIDVGVTTPFSLNPFVEAKRLRFVAAATEERMERLPDVPTWRELGVDCAFNMFRYVVGPKGLTQDQVAFWEHSLKTITATDEWKKEIDKHFLSPKYANSAETAAIFEREEKRYRDLLTDMGVIKRNP